MIVHDLRCTDCGKLYPSQSVEYGAYGRCGRCGGMRAVTWEGGKPPATDVYGCPKTSRAAPEHREFSSRRQLERYMKKELGYEPAGDLVGGSRDSGPRMVAPGKRNLGTHRAFRQAVAKNTERIRSLPRRSRVRKGLERLTP